MGPYYSREKAIDTDTHTAVQPSKRSFSDLKVSKDESKIEQQFSRMELGGLISGRSAASVPGAPARFGSFHSRHWRWPRQVQSRGLAPRFFPGARHGARTLGSGSVGWAPLPAAVHRSSLALEHIRVGTRVALCRG